MSTGMDAAVQGAYMNRDVNLASLLADRWWTLIVRGLAAIAFGIIALVSPRTSLMVLVWFWGAYALIDGFTHLISTWRSDQAGGRGWMIFEGVVSVAAGIIAFAYTGLTALFLLMLIAAWAVITGIAEIVAAIRLRRELEGEWLLATGGVLSIIFGIILFAAPTAGIVALLWIIGVYAIVFGITLIALGARVRSWRGGVQPSEPVPSPA